jgi:AcrR family transcriptional regulator
MTAQAVREPLSRERVIAAATRLADAEGLPAVTMRGVAADLGVEAMSLYHHVRGKEALLDGLVEALLGEIESALASRRQATRRADPRAGHEADVEWRAALRERCLVARETMVRHRWAPGLISSRTSIPAGLYAYYEEILATLIGAGFTYHLAHRALHALGSMALGFAQELFSPASDGGSPDDAEAEAQLAELATLLPHLTAMVASELHDNEEDPLGWCDSQAEFEFTLDLLLDGLARHHAGRGATT